MPRTIIMQAGSGEGMRWRGYRTSGVTFWLTVKGNSTFGSVKAISAASRRRSVQVSTLRSPQTSQAAAQPLTLYCDADHDGTPPTARRSTKWLWGVVPAASWMGSTSRVKGAAERRLTERGVPV